MYRFFASARRGMMILSFLAVFALAVPVQATTIYNFYASSLTPGQTSTIEPHWDSFHLQYQDLDGDNHMSFNEIVPGSFSGVWYYNIREFDFFYGKILSVPTHDDQLSPLTDGAGNSWSFAATWWTNDWDNAPASAFTYSQEQVVPIPSTVWLLGSGLLGLAGWRKLRKG